MRPVDLPPVVPFSAFLPRWRWKQGEHVALVGPTGQGKTTAGLRMLDRRGFVVILATKPKDGTLRGLKPQGYVTIRQWPPPNDRANRVLLWPKMRALGDTAHQRRVIGDALGELFKEGNWCVFTDDVQYLTDQLGLGPTLRTMWVQARSVGISLVAATQRPVHAPREMWTQSTHLFLWRANDDADLRSLGGLGAAHSRTVRAVVEQLPPWHALYLNARTGDLLTVNLNRKVNP